MIDPSCRVRYLERVHCGDVAADEMDELRLRGATDERVWVRVVVAQVQRVRRGAVARVVVVTVAREHRRAVARGERLERVDDVLPGRRAKVGKGARATTTATTVDCAAEDKSAGDPRSKCFIRVSPPEKA